LAQGRRDLGYLAATRELVGPVLQEMGKDPASLDTLMASNGYQFRAARRTAGRGSRPYLPLAIFVIFFIIRIIGGGGRRRGYGFFGPWGGFGGGFGGGGFGGGGGGGFGGFGGGSSGGGGAGTGY